MPLWLNLLKPVIPTLGDAIGKIVLHQFTRPREINSSQPEVVATQKQIQELQAASDRNAEAIKVVAEQLENTVKAIEEGGQAAEAHISTLLSQMRQLRKVAAAAVILALLAVVCAALSWLRH